ncbi:MAG: YraN family protein [Oscillospiraceae bacterium]|jgi:putative endonuclease|nr:YraN family protein [Oscillospiraceae bacterium]
MRKEGSRGEQIALQYLINKGYKLLTSNFTAPGGEIDLIVYDDRFVVFVEVRMRSKPDYGHPLETVMPGKQRKIRRTAELWMADNPRTTLQPRIDVVAIIAPGGGFESVSIEHIENAF